MNPYYQLALAALAGIALAPATLTAATVYYDVNDDDDGASSTQAGWLATNPGSSVSFSAVGSGVVLDDRSRTDNGGGAEADMWKDFIFINGSDTTDNTKGMDVTITGLLLNTTYNISVWAYDDSSNDQLGNPRNTLWTGSNGGTSAVLSFTGSGDIDPTSLSDYTASFTGVTDGAGTLILAGRGTAGGVTVAGQPNVFLNGFSLEAVPEPSSAALLGVGGLALLLRRRK